MVVSSDCRPVAGSPSAQPALGSVKFPSSPQLPWQQPVSLCPDLAAVPHGNTIHKGNMRRCFLGQGFSPGRFQKGPCPPLCSSVTPTRLCSLDCPGITWQSLPRVRFILAVLLRSIRANQLQIGASCHVGWHAWLMPHPWPHAGLTSPQPALLSQQLSFDCNVAGGSVGNTHRNPEFEHFMYNFFMSIESSHPILLASLCIQ